MTNYAQLERARHDYRSKMELKDGCTPEQQIAMSLLHNVDVVGGSHLSVAIIISKPTLKALCSRGLIDEKAKLTKAGNDMLRSWLKETKRFRMGAFK